MAKYIRKEKKNDELIKEAEILLSSSVTYHDAEKLSLMIGKILADRNKQFKVFERGVFGNIENQYDVITNIANENSLTIKLDITTERIIDKLFDKIDHIYSEKFNLNKNIAFIKSEDNHSQKK